MPLPAAPDSQPQSPPSVARQRWRAAVEWLLPTPQPVDAREKWRACVGAGFGILLVALVARWLLSGRAGVEAALAPWLVAPLGASAVLVFAAPGSPLAQPWSVIGGNTLSALIGIGCAVWIPQPALAAATAVGLAIAVMFASRCLHPPGGASALLMVLGGVEQVGYAFHPVLLDSLLLVLAGLLYNNLTGKPWPARRRAVAVPATTGSRFSGADLDRALLHYNQVVDISRDDLEQLLRGAEAAAYQRTLGDLRCADIMTPAPLTARAGTPLREAWALMRRHRIKALPVVDVQHHIVGIVTLADFMKQIDLDVQDGLGWRLRRLVKPRRGDIGQRTVSQVMTREVRVISAERLIVDLVPVFSADGHRHIPIIDNQRRLTGIVTQSDLIRALYRIVHG